MQWFWCCLNWKWLIVYLAERRELGALWRPSASEATLPFYLFFLKLMWISVSMKSISCLRFFHRWTRKLVATNIATFPLLNILSVPSITCKGWKRCQEIFTDSLATTLPPQGPTNRPCTTPEPPSLPLHGLGSDFNARPEAPSPLADLDLTKRRTHHLHEKGSDFHARPPLRWLIWI